jgi:hypothetical protein
MQPFQMQVSKTSLQAYKVKVLQVLYLQNIEQGVDDLLDGLADIIFVRADLLESMQTQGLVTVSSFKVLAQVQQSVMVALHGSYVIAFIISLPISCR